MAVVVIEQPTAIVSLEEAKAALRVDFNDDDGLITALIAAAVQHIDGPTGWLGRALGIQTLELQVPEFGCHNRIKLPYPPHIGVESVKYLDSDFAEQTFASDNYDLINDTIWLRQSKSWPAHGCRADAVRIRFRAGYSKIVEELPVNDVPSAVKIAIMMHVGTLYENRESVLVGQGAAAIGLPMGYEALLSTYRKWT